jgi:heavy metal efflux system protein
VFEFLIRFSVRNKVVVLMGALGLVAVGVYSLLRLKVDALPDITNNQVQVITISPALPPEEVERYITLPLELALANLPNRIEMRSVSRFGLSVITIVFEDNMDTYLARQLVAERIRAAQSDLPPGIGTPELGPLSTGLSEIYQFRLQVDSSHGETYTPMELRTLQDWYIKRELLGTEGVADISSFGGFLKQYEIAYDPRRLQDLNISLDDLFQALEMNNENTGGSVIEKGPQGYYVRGLGLLKSIEEIKQVVVAVREGLPIRVGEIAQVRLGNAVRYGALTANGMGEVVGGIVLMRKGENSAAVVANVKERLEALKEGLPKGVSIVPFLDRKGLIDRTIATVERNLVEGGLIVIFVLVLLLGNIRAGLVVASVIPLAMLFALTMMHFFNVSGNLMSLGAIDFGIIVDGTVIIVESILHRLEGIGYYKRRLRLTQAEADELVLDQALKIRKSAAFGEIIILIVYLPILLMQGVEGKMFIPMAQTVSFALAGALILSLTYVPAMAALTLRNAPRFHLNLADKMVAWIDRRYLPVLKFSLRRPWVAIVPGGALLALAVFLLLRMGGEFIPRLEEGDFAVETRIMAGSSLTEMVRTTTEIEKILRKEFPEVKQVVSKIGTSEIPTDPMFIESADVIIVLKDKREWTSASNMDELVEKMDSTLSVLAGVNLSFQMPIQMRFNELMTGAKTDVAIQLYGEDLDTLDHLATEISGLVEKVQGATDIYVERTSGLPQLVVDYRRDQLTRFGLTVSDVNRAVHTAYAGSKAGVIYEGEKRFDLVLRMPPQLRNDPESVKNLLIDLPNGSKLPLKELAVVEVREGPLQIARENARRRTMIGLNIRDRDVESVVKDIQVAIAQNMDLPAGYRLEYGGQFQNLEHARTRLLVTIPLALTLILILLYFTFHSLKQTIIIFLGVPFAAIGGVIMLTLRGLPFSISAAVGFITLFGVAVLNGMVLIGYINELRESGMQNLNRQILQAVRVRLRPVLMTALVASLGFLPMALSNGDGAEVQRPMASVVIGGLISSTLLTLILMPVLFLLAYRKRKPSNPTALPIAALVGFLCFFFVPTNASAQEVLTLPAAERLAQQNNPLVREGSLNRDVQRQLIGASTAIPATSVFGSYGQINEKSLDVQVGISQSFAFPSTYVRERQLQQQRATLSEAELALLSRDAVRRTRLLYYRLLVLSRRLTVLQSQDTLNQRFLRLATLRANLGETATLEALSARNRLEALRIEARQVLQTANATRTELAYLLGKSDPFAIDTAMVPRFALPDTSLSLAPPLESDLNPILRPYSLEVGLGKTNIRLQRSRFLPEINLGYYTQTIGYRPNFNVFTFGLGLPFWFKPYQARVQAAGISTHLAEVRLENQRKRLSTDQLQAHQRLLTQVQSLRYYDETALPLAKRIELSAELAYRQGNIDYVELLQNLEQALQVQRLYLDTVDNYNQAAIELEYLQGSNR